jgi:uncharacterized protein (DUF2267 family)
MSELPALDRAFQTTRVWLKEVAEELQWMDERRVYAALRAVLHALRDRLTLAEAVHFGAQLPTFIRGSYYEGWRPGIRPLKNRSKEMFLQEVQEPFLKMRISKVDAEYVTHAILRFLNRKIAEGELSDVRGQLPKGIRSLWPADEGEKAAA